MFSLTTEHLQSLLSQLPAPYILVGDFNGHNTFWGYKGNTNRGDIIENFIANNNLCLMNDKSYTYLHPATGHLSSLDLSLCHPSLFLDFDWSVYADQCESDHFPVIIESVNTSTNDHNSKWKLNNANWELYHSLCVESINNGNSTVIRFSIYMDLRYPLYINRNFLGLYLTENLHSYPI